MSAQAPVPSLAEIDRLIRNGAPALAHGLARRRAVLDPADAPSLAAVAASGPAPGSLPLCRRVTCLAPGAAFAHRNLSRALDADRSGSAVRALKRCLVLSPADDRAMFLLAGRLELPATIRTLGLLSAVRDGDPDPPFRRGMWLVSNDRTRDSVEPLLAALSRSERGNRGLRQEDLEKAAFFALSGLMRRGDLARARQALGREEVAAQAAVAEFFIGLVDIAEDRIMAGFERLSRLAGQTSFEIVDLLARFTPERLAGACAGTDPGAAMPDPDWLVAASTSTSKPVLLVSADTRYASAILPAMLESVPARFRTHLHLLSSPQDRSGVAGIRDLVAAANGTATIEPYAAETRTVLATRRFQLLPRIMDHFGSDVCVADVDTILGPRIAERLDLVPGSIRLPAQASILPWMRYHANFVCFSDDATGRAVASAVARLLGSIEPETAPWFADQVALYAVLETMRLTRGIVPTNLLDHLDMGMSGDEDLVNLTAGPLDAKRAHLDLLRARGVVPGA